MSKVLDFLRAKFEAFAFNEVSSRPLGVLRVMVSLDVIYEFSTRWVGHKIDTEPMILVLVWIALISNWFVLFGYKTRWATAVMCVSFGILHLYFGRWLGMPVFQNRVHVFQVITVLAVAPSGRSLSVDRALEVRRAKREGREPPLERMPHWVIDVVVIGSAAIYFWAGLDKTDPAWFRGERMEHYYMHWYGSSDSLQYSPWVHRISVVAAWGATISELTMAVGLLFRRTRPYVVWLGFALHLGILYYFAVTYFSMMMLMVLFTCLPPHWCHEFFNLVAYDPASSPEPDPNSGSGSESGLESDS